MLRTSLSKKNQTRFIVPNTDILKKYFCWEDYDWFKTDFKTILLLNIIFLLLILTMLISGNVTLLGI